MAKHAHGGTPVQVRTVGGHPPRYQTAVGRLSRAVRTARESRPTQVRTVGGHPARKCILQARAAGFKKRSVMTQPLRLAITADLHWGHGTGREPPLQLAS